MYWYWYTYPYYYPPMTPLPYYPPDPGYLASLMTQWILYPYYYVLTLEMYKTIFEAWKKTIDALTKNLQQLQQ